MFFYALPGGTLRGVAPSEPGIKGHRSAPEKPLDRLWCDSLLSLVPFR
jgi:hypothetical protein